MSAGIARRFSSIGRAKNACAFVLSADLTAGGTPWPVMVKKPIWVQVRSISCPVLRRAARSPDRALAKSITGICARIGSPLLRGIDEIGALRSAFGKAKSEAWLLWIPCLSMILSENRYPLFGIML